MRRRIWQQDQVAEGAMGLEDDADETGQGPRFNRLISQEDQDAARGRRLRWLSQICEYWPLNRLATITDEDVDHVLRNYIEENLPSVHRVGAELVPTRARPPRRKGRVILAGTGPGDPELLTTATLKAIKIADLILADKLVPAAVLALVPRRTDVHIARKFPGNAENAQEELLQMGLAGVQAGRIVVRLKQGDPYLYGRGAEEYDFFRQHGFDVTVLPGITSALSAPLFAQIPPTHRAVADQVLICTGTGQKGAAPDPPVHNPHQTVIFLMALHRLSALVSSLVRTNTTNDAGSRWPKETPCAVVERASCPDQRVIRTTLEFVEAAVEEEGSRPPGLLILGWSCSVLWHGRQMWVVEDGFKGLEGLAMDGWMMPPGSPVVPATELSPPDATNHVDLEAPRIVRDAEDAALFQ
ncbi:MAG: hypothetical protein M1838_005281 [Thelocarpon superellum]|nr:MAG: hypothetical protein M1838_005281 [Thelocarpon superellum]